MLHHRRLRGRQGRARWSRAWRTEGLRCVTCAGNALTGGTTAPRASLTLVGCDEDWPWIARDFLSSRAVCRVQQSFGGRVNLLPSLSKLPTSQPKPEMMIIKHLEKPNPVETRRRIPSAEASLSDKFSSVDKGVTGAEASERPHEQPQQMTATPEARDLRKTHRQLAQHTAAPASEPLKRQNMGKLECARCGGHGL